MGDDHKEDLQPETAEVVIHTNIDYKTFEHIFNSVPIIWIYQALNEAPCRNAMVEEIKLWPDKKEG